MKRKTFRIDLMTTLHSEISIDDITLQVQKKKVRSLRLTVYPPDGRVRVSAPLNLDVETIRQFAHSKLEWIRKHQTRMRRQDWIAPLQYLSGEKHNYLGKQYELSVITTSGKSAVILNGETIELYVRKRSSRAFRMKVLDTWYRERLNDLIPPMIEQYEGKMGVSVAGWGIKKMRTKWGTCNITKRKIWINLEMAKKSIGSIEHLVVHEMVHLLERKHNAKFKQLMDQFLPQWRSVEL